MNGYCMKCRTEKTIIDSRTVVMKNGRYATEGKCPSCGEWNTLEEQKVIASGGKSGGSSKPAAPVALGSVELVKSERFATGIGEFDDVEDSCPRSQRARRP